MDEKDFFSEYHSLWIIFKNKQDQKIHEVEFIIIHFKTRTYNQKSIRLILIHIQSFPVVLL